MPNGLAAGASSNRGYGFCTYSLKSYFKTEVYTDSFRKETTMKYVMLAACCALVVGCTEAAKPSRTDVTTNKPVVKSDNSGVNTRDRDKTAKTPLDQSQNKNDIQITADIRKRVVDEKMSVDATNVKIITADGRVTLRSPVVSSADERQHGRTGSLWPYRRSG